MLRYTICERFRGTPARTSLMRTYLSDTRRSHSPKFYYVGRSVYDAIRDQGIMPQALLAQEHCRSGKGRKGSEGRRHVHLISEEDWGQDVMSGFRENATMVIAVDARR